MDDASSDQSLEILRSYEKMDPRIRILTHEKNLGQGAARNQGLDCARGKYIYMMDADDLIAEGTFRTLHKECVGCRPDIICFENSQFTDDPSFTKTAQNILFSYEGAEGIYNGRDAFITLIRGDILSPSVPTYLISGDFIRQYHLRFEEGLPHEDIGFIFEMLIHAGKVQLMHKQLYLRRFRAQSTVTDIFGPKRACGYLNSWKKAFENRDCILQEHGEDQEYLAAWRKWSRDVLGRIRMLYLNSGPENGHREEGLPKTGTYGITEELLLAMLRETTTVPGRARYILGEVTAEQLEQMKEVYICGFGQYMNRMLDVIGALDVVIKGIITSREERKERRSIRGFRVLTPEEIPDKQTPVILAVSHYNKERYGALLREAGLEQILHVSF